MSNGSRQVFLSVAIALYAALGVAQSPALHRTGHTKAVAALAFSVDGQRLGSGGWDGQVKIYDAASGEAVRTLQGHREWVEAVAFSPDGRHIASASKDAGIIIWEVESGKLVREFGGPSATRIFSMAFAPDGRTLATTDGLPAGASRTARPKVGSGRAILWDVASGTARVTIEADDVGAYAVAFSPNGRTVATGGFDDKVKLWDAATGQHVRSLAGHRNNVEAVAFSPDGRLIASGSSDSSAIVWDVAGGRTVHELRGPKGEREFDVVHSVAFSPDGKRLATGQQKGSVKLWEVESGREVRAIAAHTDSVRRVVFAPEGRTAASASLDKSIKLWDTESGALLRTWGPPPLWKITIVSQSSSAEPPHGFLGQAARSGQQYFLLDVELENLRTTSQAIESYGTSAFLRPRAGNILTLTDVVWPEKVKVADMVRKLSTLGGGGGYTATRSTFKHNFPNFTYEVETSQLSGRRSTITVLPARPTRFTFVFVVPIAFQSDGVDLQVPDELPVPLRQ